MTRWRLAYLVTHPIQYQAPLLRRIAADPEIDLTVFFASTISVGRFYEKSFGREIAWESDLLEGYRHEFLPALGRRDRLSFWRPLSYGLGRRLKAGRFDALWIHGYARAPHLTAMLTAKRLGIKVLIRDETSETSTRRGPLRRAVKWVFLKALGWLADGYLAIGSRNRSYYRAHGIPADRIFDMPYAVDNEGIRAAGAADHGAVAARRAALGLAPDTLVILFVGKLVPRKAPDLLLDAYARLCRGRAHPPAALLFAGDGALRPVLEARTRALCLDQVGFLGFTTQADLPVHYGLADIFVLPSLMDPFPLVVMEAMNGGCAMVLSDRVGGAPDLVIDGENGYVVETGDVAGLAEALGTLVADPGRCRAMGRRSLEIVDGWSFREDVAGLRAALHALVPHRRGAANLLD